MNDSQLAAILGVTRARVSQLKQQGMPTGDPQAAIAWRNAHVRPRAANVTESDRTRALEAAVRHVNAIGLAAQAAIEAGIFGSVADRLAQAFLALPEEGQDRVTLPVQVWDALCGDRLTA